MQTEKIKEHKAIKLRPYQEEALASIPEAGAYLICMATGLGKCFAPGTPILMYDGSLVLSEPKLIIPAEDSLGRIMWNGRPEPAQKVFNEVYMKLKTEHKDKRAIWDLGITRLWGEMPATEKQKILIRKHVSNCDVERLTKFEAAQILTRCMVKGSAYEPATEKQKYFLRLNGYEVEGLSKYDAMQLIRRLKSE